MFSSELVNENNYQEISKNEIVKTQNMLTPLSEVSNDIENLVAQTA